MSARRFWLNSFLALSLGLTAVAWGYSQWYLSNYTQRVTDRVLLLSELRRGALQEYFATAEAELRFWNTNARIVAAQEQFIELWHRKNSAALATQLQKNYWGYNSSPGGGPAGLEEADGSSDYRAVHAQLHTIAELFVTERGYYDMFLIGLDGDVYYTVEKERDFASNLKSGEWRDTQLASVYQRALMEPGSVVTSDMQAYAPSAGDPAIFMAQAIIASNGNILGVIAFQLPTASIVDIMSYTAGMRETGETYLVGQDKLMRSDSRFSEISAVLQQSVDTVTANKALSGEEGVEYTQNYRGVEVLSAYSSFTVDQTTWAIMTEIERNEIASIAARQRPGLSGILAFFFGLSLWSLWYWQGRQAPGDTIELASFDLDPGDFPDGPGVGG